MSRQQKNSQVSESTTHGVAPAGYRLPAATTVGHVVLQVADLGRSLEYYQRVLGMAVQSQSSGVVRLGPHDDTRVLIELRERRGVRAVPRRGLLGLYHFAILLPGRAALGRFLRHLGTIREPAGMSDHLVSEAIYLTDPDGLGIEVYADRPRETWRFAESQLQMRTDPLDIEALLQVAGDEPWTGVPRGTVMGHIHLFVGDIARAESFYHAALGFDKVVWTYPGALFMSAGGYHHHLGTNTWAAGAPSATDDDARLVEWVLQLPDVVDARAAAESLRQAGNAVEQRDDGWAVVDPWGTKLVLR